MAEKMPLGDRHFDFGVNLAWLNCANGHDLGANPYFSGPLPHPDWGVAWSDDLVRTYLLDIAARGFTVVRVWAFEKLEGLLFEHNRFDPTMVVSQKEENGEMVIDEIYDNYERYNIPAVSGLQAQFCTNVVKMMHFAAEAGLDIYWTMLSSGNYFVNPHGHHAWALRRMLEDPACRDSFISNAFVPFLELLSPFSNVYAVDLINEPEGFSYKCGWRRIVSLDKLEAFASRYIYVASDAVRSFLSGCKVSVGFRSRVVIESNLNTLAPVLDFF